EVVRPDVGGSRAPIAGSQVLEELDPRATALRPERGDPEASSEDLVQVLLLGAVVLARSGHSEPERIAVAAEAPLGVSDHDGRVIDAEEEAVARPAPLGVPLVGRELEDLEGMAVGILEIEGADPPGVRVAVGQALRRRRDVLDPVGAHVAGGPVHVDEDDDAVPGPETVAA